MNLLDQLGLSESLSFYGGLGGGQVQNHRSDTEKKIFIFLKFSMTSHKFVINNNIFHEAMRYFFAK